MTPPRIPSDDELLAMPADKQAQVLAELESSQLTSNQPILEDIASVRIPGMSDAAGALNTGLNYYHDNINPVIQSGLQNARAGLQADGQASGMEGFADVGSLLTHIPGMLSNMIQSPTRGDVARGVGSAVGGVAGAAAGTPVGLTIPGMIAGGAAGQNLTDSAIRKMEGTYGDKTWTDTAIQSGMGALQGGMMKNPLQDPIRKQLVADIDKIHLSEGINELVSIMRPTATEAATLFDKNAASIKTDLVTLIGKYDFKVDSLESIQKQVGDLLGRQLPDGEIQVGSLVQNINASARALDAVVPAEKFSVYAPNPETGKQELVGGLYARLKDFRNEVSKSFSSLDERDAILEKVDKEIEAIRGQFVPAETISEMEVAKKISDKASAKLAKKRINPLMGEKKKQLQQTADEALSKYNELKEAVKNPEVNFEKLVDSRQQLDKLSAAAHENPESGLLPEQLKKLSNTVRDHEDVLAAQYSQPKLDPTGQMIERPALISPEAASGYADLKEHYSLIEGLRSKFDNIALEAARDPGSKRVREWPKTYLQARPGTVKPTFVGSIANSVVGRKTAAMEIKSDLGRLDTLIRNTNGGTTPARGVVDTGKVALSALINQTTANNAARIIPITIAGRSLEAYSKDPANIESLKQSFFISSLKNFGAPISESGADLSQIDPGMVQQAHMEAEQMGKMLSDAISMGDEEDQGIALTKLAKISPDSFTPSKSGIKGEVMVGGKRKLYDPLDRAKYTDKLKTDKALSSEEKALKISQLNDDYTIS